MRAQKQCHVSHPPANRYAQWRERLLAAAGGLRDDSDHPPESLLQAVWLHQRLQRDQLRTLDGEPVRVLHPGFPNPEGGPDFRGAMLRIGEAPPRTGDVEVDLSVSGWRAHGHDRNPAFANVLLRVVWDAAATRADTPAIKTGVGRSPGSASPPPALPLRNALDAPLAELSRWLELQPARAWPEALEGRCAAPLRGLSESERAELLRQAARVRFEARAAQLRARARLAGWEQALWEGVFRALGYKHNVWPMQCLAETRARWWQPGDPPSVLQARLLGLSGLLPEDLPRRQARSGTGLFLRRVWDVWWRERDALSDCALPRAVWHLRGLRPANQPPRRLALAAHWLARGDLPSRLERWGITPVPDSGLVGSLERALDIPRDEFWSWHWTWNSARLPRAHPLLGEARLTDMAINVLLPWLWTRAVEGGDETLATELMRRFLAWPPAQDNAVLRLARARLLGGAPLRPAGAALQQGLIQVVRDFCEHSNALCEQCRFPELVRRWAAGERPPG
ncbi:MAG: DUF2851 family protein [Verrucomicrobiae bacterium]|nr:DUF2851 family protein [Verrucomicrobiae bacterium]